MSNVVVKTRNRTPTSVAISAIQLYSKIYKIPAISRVMMEKVVSWRKFSDLCFSHGFNNAGCILSSVKPFFINDLLFLRLKF